MTRIDPILSHPYVAPVDDFKDFEMPEPVKKKELDKAYYEAYFKSSISKADHYLDTKLYDLVLAQRTNHEESSKIASVALKGSISATKEIRDELFDQQDELIKKQKISGMVDVVDTVSMVGLIAAGAVSFLFAIFTGGVGAIPVVLVGANALLAVINGGAKIANGVIKYQADEVSAKIFELSEKRKMIQTKETDYMDEQGSSKDKANEAMNSLSKNEEKKQETIRLLAQR